MDRRKPRHNSKKKLGDASARAEANRQGRDLNFILGYGERLTKRVSVTKGPSEKVHPYNFTEAQRRLLPKLNNLVQEIGNLPPLACPNDEVVAAMALHPAYVAKSYFPSALLGSVGLRVVGSRSRQIPIEKWNKTHQSPKAITADLFVAGKRGAFQRWNDQVMSWQAISARAEDLRKIEDLILPTPISRLASLQSSEPSPLLEIVLHASEKHDAILKGFQSYLASLDIPAELARKIFAGGLCFLPLRVPREKIDDVLQFSFLRVAREMPQLRPLPSILREVDGSKIFSYELPIVDALNKNLRVAVFDGGMPSQTGLNKWVTYAKANGVSTEHPDGLVHGLSVTSALLFGPLEKNKPLDQPFCNIDHYCVLDSQQSLDTNLFDILERIVGILEKNKYEFVNLSLGPRLPIEDNDVHVWTSVLDQYFSKQPCLVSVAVGNDGERDWTSGNARIQPPSDCVNALAVGSSDTLAPQWRRAKYSCIGPGRSPGYFKPDVVAFGGSFDEPFWVIDSASSGKVRPIHGTSFSSPLTLRLGIGVRTHLGPDITPIALKALLIHTAQREDGHDAKEVGWGRIKALVQDVALCDDSAVTILFQGYLDPSKYLRIPIPIPAEPLLGKVTVSATICFVSEIDPEHPFHYTRSGLEVTFRPDSRSRKKQDQQHPSSLPFFSPGRHYQSEMELRHHAFKWETTLHASKNFYGSSLHDPAFDVHYIARAAAQGTRNPKAIPYAFVITLKAPRHPDLYNKLLTRYRTQLEPLRPQIAIPIQTRGS